MLFLKEKHLGEKKTVVPLFQLNSKTLSPWSPNFHLMFPIMSLRQPPATRSISASEFLLGLRSYHGCYLGLLSEIAGQGGTARHNAMKSTGSLLKSFMLLFIFPHYQPPKIHESLPHPTGNLWCN